MPENDEPLDDARAVAMNAAAAAARVAETLLRDQQDRARDRQGDAVGSWGGRPMVQAYAEHERPEPHERGLSSPVGQQQETPVAGAERERRAHVAHADAWLQQVDPDRAIDYAEERSFAESANGPLLVDRRVVREWTEAGSPLVSPDRPLADYDSPSRRAAAEAEMSAVGVPAEVRNARNVSDVLNGQDPGRAAAAGSKASPKNRTSTRRPERQRGR